MTARQFTTYPLTEAERAHRAAGFARRAATRTPWTTWEADRERRDAESVRELHAIRWQTAKRVADMLGDKPEGPLDQRGRTLLVFFVAWIVAIDAALTAESEAHCG